MAKPRLARSEKVRMKKAILQVANEILETKDDDLKQSLINSQCAKYDWYADVVKYIGVQRIIDLNVNITALKNECIEKNYELGMLQLDSLFKKYMKMIVDYLLSNNLVKYGDFKTHRECAELLISVCNSLGIVEFSSSGYFTLLFDVRPGSSSEANTSGYYIMGEHTQYSYLTKGRLQSALL